MNICSNFDVNIIFPNGYKIGKVFVTSDTTFDQLFGNIKEIFPQLDDSWSMLHTGICNYRSCDLDTYQHYDTVWEVVGKFKTLIVAPKLMVTSDTMNSILDFQLVLTSIHDIKELTEDVQDILKKKEFPNYLYPIYVKIIKIVHSQNHLFYCNRGQHMGSIEIFW